MTPVLTTTIVGIALTLDLGIIFKNKFVQFFIQLLYIECVVDFE